MHGAVSEELKADGFAVLSEFSRSDAQPAGAASGTDPHDGRDEESVPEKAPGRTQNGKTRIWRGHIRGNHIRKTHIWGIRPYKLLKGWKD